MGAQTSVGSANPRIILPQDVPRKIKEIPTYTRFGYSGLAYYKGGLYASSNIGLFEFQNGKLTHLYKWDDRDDVVSGPWIDQANDSLWLFHNGLNKLIRFDGKEWAFLELPRPKYGYTRMDMLKGFQGVSSDKSFWLQIGGSAWRLDASKNGWVSEPRPEPGLLVSMAPLKDKTHYIVRHKYASFFPESAVNRPNKPFTDGVYLFNQGEWKESPESNGLCYFAKQVLAFKDVVFILTESQQLLRLTSTEIKPIKTLGEIEAMTSTSTGTLLVSFRNQGIYEYTNDWQQKFPSPYPKTETSHWAYLSEYDGEIALAITPKPQWAGDGTWSYSGLTTLWISSGNEWKAIPLEGEYSPMK
ncbi:MAG TPA: hypothetical protein PLB32_22205 [Acidobacteriota bacterium]|nr:hypothetical protein [Acidobacteriota bacterium]